MDVGHGCTCTHSKLQFACDYTSRPRSQHVFTQAGQDHSMCSRKQAKITACVHTSRPRSQHVFTQAGQDHSMCSRKQAKITACVHTSRPRSQRVLHKQAKSTACVHTSRPRSQHVFKQAGHVTAYFSNFLAVFRLCGATMWIACLKHE